MIKKELPLFRGRSLPRRNVTIFPAFTTTDLPLILRSNILYEPRAVISDWVKFQKALSKRVKKLLSFSPRGSTFLMISLALIGLIPFFNGSSSYLTPSKLTNPISIVKAQEPANKIISKIETNESPEFNWPVKGYISQTYSFRHKAIDIAATYNNPVSALAEGIVEKVYIDIYGLGKVIVVKHIDGFRTIYAHLNKILVKENDAVSTGKVIGSIGLTGRTTGAHLHIELESNGKKIDPTAVLEKR